MPIRRVGILPLTSASSGALDQLTRIMQLGRVAERPTSTLSLLEPSDAPADSPTLKSIFK